MNQREESTTPRWTGEIAGQERPLSQAEREVVVEVLGAMRRLRHGVIQLNIQDGRVVQVDITEKRRL